MAKDKISDYSSTANSNTDIAGINIDEGCAPSGINDAIRTLMAQLKTWQSGGQDVYIHPAGSASAPSITANGDTNTGIFFPAADTVGITTGGTERARVDSAGNLGLGVTPSAWSGARALQVGSGAALFDYGSSNVVLGSNLYFDGTNNRYINTDFSSYYQQNNGVHSWGTAASGTAGNAITFTQAMTLDASGRLGIARTSPGAQLDVLGAASTSAMRIVGNSGASIYVDLSGGGDNYYDATNNIFRNASGTERARITSGGFFKQTNNGAYLDVNGSYNEFNNSTTNAPALYIYSNSTSFSDNVFITQSNRNTTNNSYYAISYYNAAANAYKFRVADSGNVTNTNNSYGAISDIKLKENITDATPKLAQLNQVRVVNYNFIGSNEKQLGVVAQELEQLFPSMVDESPDKDAEGNDLGTTTKSVKYSVFVPMLIKAIQEQQAIITQLQADVAALKGQA